MARIEKLKRLTFRRLETILLTNGTISSVEDEDILWPNVLSGPFEHPIERPDLVEEDVSREGDVVYCAADFPWWRELEEGPGRGSVFIQGEELPGTVRAVLDDPEFRESVFRRLRPTAPLFAGTLVVIDLD